MLSILIPTYNYNVVPLVLELQKQCLKSGIQFEILVKDDFSNLFIVENETINTIENCRFSRNLINLGRGRNINLLAQEAQFDFVLIMDCDTFPVQDSFILNYEAQINKNQIIVFGGIEYQKKQPKNDQLLRWIYGKSRETLPVEKRNNNPNGTALTSNLLMKKEEFILNSFDDSITKYGYEDLVFLTQLKNKGLFVKHINNPTYHLGLETSNVFLEKTKIALLNIKNISTNNPFIIEESKLLYYFLILKKMKLTVLISWFFSISKRKLERNLLSNKPSLIVFDFYKIGYFCSLNQ